MATRRASATEIRNSIDASAGDEDTEMKDVQSEVNSDVDAEGEPDDGEDGRLDMLQTIQDVTTYLCKVEEDGEELAAGFQRIPNRRMLPDYFEVIPDPIAFSTIRSKIQRKLYTTFTEFVKDVAQICHNAQVYNRPSAPIFGAAQALRKVFETELRKLAEKGQISDADATIPNLGELPPAEDSPPPGSDEDDEDDEEDDEDEDEEEDDDDGDDSDAASRRLQSRRRRSQRGLTDRDVDVDDEAQKRRGRPPSVLTPTEARIHSLLRGLRKPKDEDNNLLISPFERLPDKTAVPDYYQTIAAPIALDQIKRKAKRKKYQDVDHAMVDVELMFENAKLYNEDDSELFQAAVELQRQARILAEQEKAKPDEDFRDEDGKLPLAEIQYNGQIWRVGDWVHIRNPNDLAKPIVAQIFRTWQDQEGQKWVNACWYYRPEQTVHRSEKHFFEHEVVKTGQYRDHHIEDILDHCFVMFVTRFPKGRPRGFPPNKSAYVCESRYNEEKFSFAKIKTWASCVPDEVREKDYEMDLFEIPRRMKKVPSPIKHLLREDAKETDELPRPTWGSPNAPPIVGAVHRRPRADNESPPPELSPPPSATMMHQIPPENSRRPSAAGAIRDPQNDMAMRATPGGFSSGQTQSPGHYNAHMVPQFQPGTPGPGGPATQQTPVPIPHQPHYPPGQPQAPIRQMSFQQAQHQSHFQAQQHQYQYQASAPPQIHPPHYSQSPGPPMHQRQHMPGAPPPSYNQLQGPAASRPLMGPASGNVMPPSNMYNPPRPPEVYTLPDNLNEVFPDEVRQQFQHDREGRVLFFTAPPLDRDGHGLSPDSARIGHSMKYLAGRRQWLIEKEKKRKERGAAVSTDLALKRHRSASPPEPSAEILSEATDAIATWFDRFDNETKHLIETSGLEGWRRSPKKSTVA